MREFYIKDASLDTQWRSLIIFGKNTASYKFAFAKSLLDLVNTESTIIKLEDLATPYSRYIMEHLKHTDKQANSATSKFLDACRSRLAKKISDDELHQVTMKEGFKYVVDAFQNVGGSTIEKKFYEKDYEGRSKQIVITNELLSLKNLTQYVNLKDEVESRWRLVETAWNIGISPNLLEVKYDDNDDELFIQTERNRRQGVTTARGALNGYQKGKCFYCRDDISIVSGDENICHVDHFLPQFQEREHYPANINGVWNLVLSCSHCNGSSEKWMKIPDIQFLYSLNNRNEFYISSKHPLAETIINQTGSTKELRSKFLQKHYQIARDANPIASWKPKEIYDMKI